MDAMAQLLLNLHQVPEDEALEVRSLLDEAGIGWYETQPSFWGVSHGGIWVREDAEAARARQLLHAYEAERSARMRAEWAAARAAGTAPTLWTQLRDHPGQAFIALLAIAFAVALVALPVWLLS